jgi:hypothetical protein
MDNKRCLILLTLWLALTMGGSALLAAHGLRELVGTAVVLIPWLTLTLVTLAGVLYAPEEV